MFLSSIFDPQPVPPEIIEYRSLIGDMMLQLSCDITDSHMPTSRDDMLESLRHLFEARNKAIESLIQSSLDKNRKLSLSMSLEVAVGPFISLVQSKWGIKDFEIVGANVLADMMSSKAKLPTLPPPAV